MEKFLSKEMQGSIGSAYDAVHGRLVVAEWAGNLVAVDDDGRHVLGTGYTQLEDVVLSADGSWALVTERGGALLRVSMATPDRSAARAIATGLQAPHQIALAERAGTAYLVEHGSNGRLLALSLRGGRRRTIATGLTNAVGLVVDRALTTAYVTEQTPGSGQLIAVSLATGTRRTLATGLTAPFMMCWEDATESTLLIAERDPANRIAAVRVTTANLPAGNLSPFERLRPFGIPGRRAAQPDPFGRHRIPFDRTTVDLNGRLRRLAAVAHRIPATEQRPSSVQSIPGLGIFVISDRSVVLFQDAVVAPPHVDMDVDADPMFIGAFQRIPVKVSGAGVTFDDVEFEVAEGPRGGRVSPSRDDRFDPASPHVMLLAGYEAGTFTLVARHRTTNATLGTTEFTVTDLWRGEDGPPLWFDGVSQAAVTGAAWGGGTSGPQNVPTAPVAGNRRVAILLVDTSTQRYPADTSTLRTEWADETFNGVTVGGKTVSCHHYFQELSGGSFGLANAGVVGAVQLPGSFEDYFALSNGLWVWQAGFFQAAVTAGDGLIDYTQVDSLVVVVRSAAAADPTSPEPALNMPRFAWPWATGGNFATAEGSRPLAVVVMPHDWGDSDDREIFDTLTHELGHNIGLPDQYMDAGFGAVAPRDIGSWDIMSWDDPLPHMTAATKVRLGWTAPAAVRTFNFAGSGAVDETVTLRAAELGAPPAGQFSAIEVRIANGWNYYFEYRSEQGTQIGDQALPTDRRVLGTDVISPSFTAPIARRETILLRNDPDGDGPILDTGQDYEETDVSDPLFPTDFSVTVVSTATDSAQVRIRYGANSRPDPSIRPWPGSGTDAWQSPDIEVRNARNATDPARRNIPWTGHPNQIVAKVRNVGSLLAQDVRVDFSVKDFTLGGAPEFPLGSATADIPANTTVEVGLDGWVPGAGNHYCVVARMPLHIETGPPVVVEMTELNNLAQSNYTEFISATASPAARQRTLVTVGNPYAERTRVHIVPTQTNPFFRTYLSHTLVELEPGEVRRVEVMFESLHGTSAVNDVFERDRESEKLYREPNIVNVSGYIEDPRDSQLHSVHALGGVIAQIRSGTATRVEGMELEGTTVYGRVVASDDGKVREGQVIVAMRRGGDASKEITAVGDVEDGRFHARFDEEIPEQDVEVIAEFLGDRVYAPSPPARLTR